MRYNKNNKPFSFYVQQTINAFLQSVQDVRVLLKAHPYWYGLFVAFCLAFYVPARWLWGNIWGSAGSAASWQIIVPFCVLFLIWSKRAVLYSVWQRPKNRGMMGNPLFFILGWLLYLLSLFFQGPLLAFLGLVLMTWGGIFWLFGGVVLRSLWMPFLFSFLLVPLPQSALAKLKYAFQLNIATIDRVLLNRIGITTSVQEVPTPEGNHHLVFVGSSLSLTYNSTGIGVLCIAAFLALFYGAMRHYPFLRCLFLMTIAAIFGFLFEILRVFIAGAMFGNAPTFSLWLIDISPWWFASLATLGVMFLDWRFLHTETRFGRFLTRLGRPLERISRSINKPLDVALDSSVRVAARAGRAIEKSGRPIEKGADWLNRMMRPLRRFFRHSNRNVEDFLGRFDSKKRRSKRRRRSRD
jgi:hypothetical protein